MHGSSSTNRGVGEVLRAGGRSAWGEDVRGRLELREERRFASGVVHLRYDVAHGG